MSKPDDTEMLRLENDIWRMMSVRERNLREADIQRHMENEARLMATIHQLQEQLERAVRDEREACAKVCDEWCESVDDHEAGAALNIRNAIRARGGAE